MGVQIACFVVKIIILYSSTYMQINMIHDTYLKRWTAKVIPIKGPLTEILKN